ncbi:MAG: hypothetical protein BAJALOKI1v1_1650007 [Promethearchaeota archaeon]|nr:MAG: hypothetical protein BAJALOKI1v1_1650007 [Candidatus Lokiarchaeota archaeon]
MPKNNSLNIQKRALVNYFYTHNKLDQIPPIVGILFADLFGNAIMTYEYEDHKKYNPLTSYLSNDKNSLLEIDFVSMYFSSFNIFASNNNIKDLSYLEIHGSNLKVQISFIAEKFMIILFLNSSTILPLKTQQHITNHFKEIIEQNKSYFEDFNAKTSQNVIKNLTERGCEWLQKLNRKYIQEFKQGYLKKSEFINIFMNKINPIIQQELKEYLPAIPEELISDVSRDIKDKLHDEVFELASELFKK